MWHLALCFHNFQRLKLPPIGRSLHALPFKHKLTGLGHSSHAEAFAVSQEMYWMQRGAVQLIKVSVQCILYMTRTVCNISACLETAQNSQDSTASITTTVTCRTGRSKLSPSFSAWTRFDTSTFSERERELGREEMRM